MAKEINLDKEIWEGWTVRDFIKELQPQVDAIMRGQAITHPFESKQELKRWLRDAQPYYKKEIPEVVKYFSQLYCL